jgi:hypothetical protein
VNAEVTKEGKGKLTLTQTQSGGHTFYTITGQITGDAGEQAKLSVHYVFEEGYLVAAPSQALLERSLQQRESGVSLASHPKFRDLLGQDGQVNVSAFFYQNLGPVLDSASGLIPEGKGPGGQDGAALKNLILGQGPTLVYAYAEEDRILFASSSNSPLGLNLQTLAGFGGILGVMDEAHSEAVEEAVESETSGTSAR